jgi:hypothetical protein
MPRTIQQSEKLRWLEKYEQGKSEKQIATEARCDVRTVRRAIQELRLRQEAKLARVELVKDALRRHQDALLRDLDEIISLLLRLPEEDASRVAWYRWEDSGLAVARELRDVHRKARPLAAASPLRDHLKNDRLWKVIARWGRAAEEHERAQAALQIKTTDLLEKKTGLRLLSKSGTEASFLYPHTAGELVYRTALQRAFGRKEDPELNAELVVDSKRGQVTWRGRIVAEARGREEQVRDAVLEALRELEVSPETTRVVQTYQLLKAATENARQTAEQVKSLGMIPGLCEICRRLGLR